MIDCNSALSHHLFQVTQAQRIGHVPAHAHQDHIERVMQAFKHARYSWVHDLVHRSHRLFYRYHHNRPPYGDGAPAWAGGGGAESGNMDKTLANWVGKARKGQPLTKRAPRQPVTDLEAENARLKQENARLRLEKEILKKAAAYFAKESL